MSASSILLFGGQSSERLVSVASAQYVADCLPESQGWFWRPDGRLTVVDREVLLAHENPFQRTFEPHNGHTFPSLEAALDAEKQQNTPRPVFIALHGGTGENGTVQAMFEARGLPFTASGAEASQQAFSKQAAKDLMRHAGIRVAPALTVPAGDTKTGRQVLDEMLARYNCVVLKPNADGSSHGLFIVENQLQKENALRWVETHSDKSCLVEAFVRGREMTTGVVDMPSGLRSLPSSEVIMADGRVFDYEGKYLGEGSTEITPADIPSDLAEKLGRLACQAHEILGCWGYSRTDFLVDENGPVFIETNTLPGLTSASFIPQQLEAAAIPMVDFFQHQLALAFQRYERV